MTKKTQAEKFVHCGQLILRKISKSYATRCQILKAKMHQLRFLMGLCPRPPGELTALLQAPELYLRGPTSKRRKGVDGRKGKGREREREGEGEGTGRKGRRGERICRTNIKLLPTRLDYCRSGPDAGGGPATDRRPGVVMRAASVDDLVRVSALLRDLLERLTDLTAAIQSRLRSAALVSACRAAISDRRLVYAVDAPPATGSA